MIRPILLLGNPELRKSCALVTDFGNPELANEIRDLKETLEDFRDRNGFGRAIAAIQIGINKRMIAMNLGGDSFVVINPTITKRSEETITLWDDCMSFPDLVVRVTRNARISIEYQNKDGKAINWCDLPEAESELLQHEMDHLDGILAIDRAITSKDILYKQEYAKNKEYYDSLLAHDRYFD